MMRPAIFGDVPRIVELLVELHPHTIYAGRCNVSEEVAHRTLRALVGRNGHTNDGGACVLVEVDDAGEVQGFIVGLLSRVYFIGNKFEANDVYLHLTDKAPTGALMRLISGYVGWADANPLVVDVKLSWSNALPSGERMASIYERLGFVRSGEVYSRPRRVPVVGVMAA